MTMRVEKPERVLWRPDEIEKFDEEFQSILWIRASIADLSNQTQLTPREVSLLENMKLALGRTLEDIDIETEKAKTLPYVVNLLEQHDKQLHELDNANSYVNRYYNELQHEQKTKRNLGIYSLITTLIIVVMVLVKLGSISKELYDHPVPKITR